MTTILVVAFVMFASAAATGDGEYENCTTDYETVERAL